MTQYNHRVSGFFAFRKDAEEAFSKLAENGMPREQLQIFMPDSAASLTTQQKRSDEVLDNLMVDGAVGTAIGAGAGALGQLALVAANVTLFVASPLIAPLVMLGWGASVGALVGVSVGASAAVEKKEGRFADLIRDAVASGQVVLVAETRTEAETAAAREVIGAAVGDYKDISTAA